MSGTAVHANMFGYRGVHWNQTKGVFVAEVWDWPNRKRIRCGRFQTAAEAAQAYDDKARELYGDEAHLNFPLAGEKPVIASKLHEGMCAHGHDLAQVGRQDGRGRWACRVCNKEAAHRYYQRKKAAKGKDDDHG